MYNSAPSLSAIPPVLNHAQLTTLRSYLSSHNSRSSVTEQSACVAAAALSPHEVARELRRLPPGATRVDFVAKLGAYAPAESFRRHVLQNPHLLTSSSESRHDAVRVAHKHAMRSLVQNWGPFVESQGRLRRLLDGLVEGGEQIPEQREDDELGFRLNEAQEDVAGLQGRMEEFVALCNGDAAGHDGLGELVSANWAQLRLRRAELSELRQKLVAKEDSCKSQRERFEITGMVQQVDAIVRALHEQRTRMVEAGFHMAPVSPRKVESDSDSEEDEWEEAVQVGNGEDDDDRVDINQTAKRIGVEVQLPEVQDWTKIMKGEEGRDMNRMILEQFEQRGGEHLTAMAQASGHNNTFQRNENSVVGVGRGKGTKRKKQASTARQRLSAALGIKKRKKKGRLDDD